MNLLQNSMAAHLPPELFPKPLAYYNLARDRLTPDLVNSSPFAVHETLRRLSSQSVIPAYPWIYAQFKAFAGWRGMRSAWLSRMIDIGCDAAYRRYDSWRGDRADAELWTEAASILPVVVEANRAIDAAVADILNAGKPPPSPRPPETLKIRERAWFRTYVAVKVAVELATELGIDPTSLPATATPAQVYEQRAKRKLKQVAHLDLSGLVDTYGE